MNTAATSLQAPALRRPINLHGRAELDGLEVSEVGWEEWDLSSDLQLMRWELSSHRQAHPLLAGMVDDLTLARLLHSGL